MCGRRNGSGRTWKTAACGLKPMSGLSVASSSQSGGGTADLTICTRGAGTCLNVPVPNAYLPHRACRRRSVREGAEHVTAAGSAQVAWVEGRGCVPGACRRRVAGVQRRWWLREPARRWPLPRRARSGCTAGGRAARTSARARTRTTSQCSGYERHPLGTPVATQPCQLIPPMQACVSRLLVGLVAWMLMSVRRSVLPCCGFSLSLFCSHWYSTPPSQMQRCLHACRLCTHAAGRSMCTL